MNWLYMFLNLGAFTIPFMYSFNPKMNFIKYWKPFLGSLTIVAIPFLIWDIFFTTIGVWGFNPKYYLGITLLKMPIEEWLFFWFIPYASLFIHFSFQYFFPKFKLTKKITKIILMIFILFAMTVVIMYYNKWYTVVNFGCFLLLMIYSYFKKIELLQQFYISFFIILIPFFGVNGILTGSIISEQIVWYSASEIIGIRIGSVPLEDIFYCFTLLFLNLIIFQKLKY